MRLCARLFSLFPRKRSKPQPPVEANRLESLSDSLAIAFSGHSILFRSEKVEDQDRLPQSGNTSFAPDGDSVETCMAAFARIRSARRTALRAGW